MVAAALATASKEPQAAEAGVVVFRVGFQRWVTEPAERGLSEVLAESFAQLRGLAAAAPAGR